MTAPVYLDPTRPVAERVEAILALMTDEQKLACLNGVPETVLADGNTLPGLTNEFNEVLHSSGKKPDATFFPQAIGLGATWDTELMEAIGAAVAHEVRARDTDVYASFGPVADIRSNPLAGRFEEGFGEDPLHVGAMTTAYAWGLRGRHPEYVKTFTQKKHFLGYNHEWHRSQSSASMSVRAYHEYQVVPYRMPVEAGAVLGAMTAYNLVNGVPSIISPIMETLRSEWAEDGVFFFLPDGWDGVNLHTTKGEPWDTWEVDPRGDVPYPTALAAEEGRAIDADENGVYASALMLLAGVSHFHDGSELPFVPNAGEAVRRGLLGVNMSHVDRSVRDWLHFLVRTGKLDGDACEYNLIPADPHPQDRPEHIALAHRAAREQLVLLKNDQAALPIPETASIAVVGPLADLNLRDFYSPTVPADRRPSPLQALRERFANVTHHSGNDTLAWRADGRYVTVADDGSLVARAEGIGATETFEAWDWAHEQHMFRHTATGRFVQANLLQQNDGPATFENQAGATGGGGPLLVAVETEMEDGDAWFTHQNLHYRPAAGDAADGDVELFGVNHVPAEADGPYHVRLAADGTLPLTKGDADPILTETLWENGPEAAAAVAAEADWAVVLVGNHPMVNARECFDRPGLDLAPRQADLVREVAAAKPGRTVVVVVSAYPLAIGDLAADPNVAAILYTSHAGQAVGAALAEALAGDFSPAGRLTSTWLADTSSLPKAGPRSEAFRVSDVDMLEYDVISAGLTYQYSKAEPVFGFGHGLSYTEFEYGALEVPAAVDADAPFTAAVDVTNKGERTSDDVVLLFARIAESAYGDRIAGTRLAGFVRAKDIAPGETRRVEIEVDPQHLFVWDVVSGKRIVETGDYLFGVGTDSEGPEAQVRIQGETIAPLDLSQTANVWEKATIAEGLTYWEVSKLHTLKREGGYHSTGSRRAGSHVGFTNAILDGAKAIELRTATTTADWTDLADPVIEVRAGSADGRLLAEVEVPKTAGFQSFTNVTAPLDGATGTQDLYLVFRTGGIYIDTIRLAR
ncbi:glycoside hydrolase family 3 C-terminal domain-containing protein [Glycomyces luteolus]|uniref:Glycoside hydrolase family 3 C-terminal domain-containing protein n=1 Tax=Glycomyces luteolus TaxID=2670330 RepID=A0A9X3PC20_9ACTN|nr:glycoside hydrolase family 3 C-terminal domain-containing protein [Glycomyces luteolus]MDA1361321.1 glycoside hydrolase family 3 C-terminal domain-containing protein [Glycomyces luteolus]